MPRLCIGFLGSVLLAVAGLITINPTGSAPAGATVAVTVPRPAHVVIAIEENHGFSQVIGNSAAPYINGIAASGANFTQAFAETHPSQPNYLALFSGSTQGVTDDSCPHSFTAPSLGSELLHANFGFAGYSEGLPSVGYSGCFAGAYARKHNPWSDFPAIPASANRPFTAFPADYASLPAVSVVVPNLNNDMHDGSVAQGDLWLKNNLGGYISWANSHNSLFVLAFDENDGLAGNHIPTIITGQQVVRGTYSETINHYNILRTIEAAFALPAIGASASAHPILDIWSPSAANQPPTASFTSSCTALTCTFDGSGSTDPDGTVASYAWSFGDGTSGSGRVVSHGYAAAGPESVTLTVTDNGGAIGSVTHPIDVGTATGVPFAADNFNRTVTSGFGTATVGGAWATTGPASYFSVVAGRGLMKLPAPAAQLSATLAPTSTSTDLSMVLSADKVGAGGVYLTALGRQARAGYAYECRVRLVSSTVQLWLSKVVSGTETALVPVTAVASYSPGTVLNVRVQVTGTNPTIVRARVWPATRAEPATWQASATDSAPGLQAAGNTGIVSYLSRWATDAPVTVRVGQYAARPIGAAAAAMSSG